MKFAFKGCPGAETEVHNLGRHWVKGVPVDVTEPELIERLQSHPYYEVVADDAPQAAPLVEAPAAPAENAFDLTDEELERLTAPDAEPQTLAEPQPKRRGRPPKIKAEG